MPVSSALVGVLLLGEHFSIGHALGMALVLAALVLGTRRRQLPPVAAGRADVAK